MELVIFIVLLANEKEISKGYAIEFVRINNVRYTCKIKEENIMLQTNKRGHSVFLNLIKI